MGDIGSRHLDRRQSLRFDEATQAGLAVEDSPHAEDHIMRLFNLSAWIVGVSVSCLLLAAAPLVRTQDKADPKNRLKELLQERVVAARKIHDFAVKGYTQGDAKFTIDQVHAAKAKLFEARLDLSETREQRRQAHQEAVKDAAEWERTGAASPVDQLKSRLYRLEREIALTAYLVAANQEFNANVTNFAGGKIGFRTLNAGTGVTRPNNLAVSSECKFLKVKFNKETNKDEPDGELPGGKDAFTNLVKETIDAERKEFQQTKVKKGLGGVFCRLVTEGDDPPRVIEIHVFSPGDKNNGK